ncbi:MAG: apolipoprotein N-acyltransferase [Candidatus Latescibacteria bacterium]|nr:apolipoprotein N-acyltransferase [Candidatus Latescibacterota bacterium]MDP7632775.1 apolipoprotein N-acyltransferase [Candidatus Latescibacterota bacterium]
MIADARPRQPLIALIGLSTGLLWTWSQPTVDAGWLGWVCLIPSFYLLLHHNLSGRDAWLLGASAGLTAGLGRVYWVSETLQSYGGLAVPLAYLTTFLLAAYVGLYPMIALRWARSLSPGHRRRLPWLIASIWVLLDWILSWLFTGFPWALLGYSQYQSTTMLPIAALTGVHGLTFTLVAANVALAQLLGPRREGWALAALLVPSLMGLVGVRLFVDRPEPMGSHRVGIVQGSVEQGAKWQTVSLTETTGIHLRLARQLDRTEPLDLVVFPETAFPFRFDHPSYEIHRRWLAELAQELQTSLLVGSLGSASESGDRGLFNRAFLIDRAGEVINFADKVHLVPFGEYLPLKWIFGYLDELTAESGAFDPGQVEHKVLQLRQKDGVEPSPFAVFICYESIFPQIARQQTLAGAQFLINTTNDGWFGTTSAPAQHLSMAVLRAVENGRAVVRAANTGISCFIDAQGGITKPTSLFEKTAIQGTVGLNSHLTPYTRLGDLVVAVSALLLAISFTYDGHHRRRTTNRQVADARQQLDAWAASASSLEKHIVLVSGYDSDASVWAPLLAQLKACFIDADERITAVDLRHDLSIEDLSAHVASLVADESDQPLVFVGHSLGGMVSIRASHRLPEAASQVIAVASPFGGTVWATLARWSGRECPRTLVDLGAGSLAARSINQLIPETTLDSLRLAGDMLSCHPVGARSMTTYEPALLVGPRTRHTLLLQDPRILRDIVGLIRG